MKKIKKGFTLVEVLVCIAILGILAGLLYPVIQAAKKANEPRNIHYGQTVYVSSGFYKGCEGVVVEDDYVEGEFHWKYMVRIDDKFVWIKEEELK